MQILIDKTKKELKAHGSHEFPLLVSYEKISAYESGSFIWHWHPEIELTLVTNGDMIYRINNEDYHIYQGDALFGNCNVLHAGTMYQNHDCTYISITFDAKLISGFEGSSVYDKYVQPLINDLSLSSIHFNRSKQWHSEIIHAIETISTLYDEKKNTYEIDILLELYRILKVMHLHVQMNKNISSYDKLNYGRIKTIIFYIENNYDKDLTLDQIANQIHVCKNECCRIFKSYTRQSLFEFINEFRIEKSIHFLMENKYSISEVAIMSGFNDSNYYSRTFKKQKGCSPIQYLKKIKAQKSDD